MKDLGPLAANQQARLVALLDKLGSLPTAEAIVGCAKAVGIHPGIETDRARMDAASAGAWAFDRTLMYVERLRSLNAERMQIGNEIRHLLATPYPTT